MWQICTPIKLSLKPQPAYTHTYIHIHTTHTPHTHTHTTHIHTHTHTHIHICILYQRISSITEQAELHAFFYKQCFYSTQAKVLLRYLGKRASYVAYVLHIYNIRNRTTDRQKLRKDFYKSNRKTISSISIPHRK